MARNTRTGRVLEQMVLPSLTHGGYTVKEQINIGNRPAGRRHFVDAIASKDDENFLISLKNQEVGGTAEEKVPWEVICLIAAVKESKGLYKKAYLVLGGIGWTLRDFYTSGGLKDYLEHDQLVEVVTLEMFMHIANKSKL